MGKQFKLFCVLLAAALVVFGKADAAAESQFNYISECQFNRDFIHIDLYAYIIDRGFYLLLIKTVLDPSFN